MHKFSEFAFGLVQGLGLGVVQGFGCWGLGLGVEGLAFGASIWG